MEESLQQSRKSLQECDRFVCPRCNAIYDSLEVQKLEIDGFDAHFICYCGVKVELDDREAKDSVYSSQQQRCEEQVKTLKKCLTAAWGMEVPQFPLYVKSKEKAAETITETKSAEKASSTVEGGSSVASGYSGTSDGGNTNTPRPVVKSLLSYVNRPQKNTISGRGETGKIKFHMRGASTRPNTTRITTPIAEKVAEELPNNAEVKTTVTKAPSQEAALPSSQETPIVEQGESITFYIEKLGRSFSLEEAQNYQKHMNNEEFEKFLDLQERYLNIF